MKSLPEREAGGSAFFPLRSLRVGGTVLLAVAAVLLLVVAPSADAASRVKLGELCSVAGSGGGQCSIPEGVAVNATGAGGVGAGDVYVVDLGNDRIQAFSPEGEFERAFGLEVDETTGGDICTAESEDVCKAGVAGEAAGGLSNPFGIAIDQGTGAVYVSDSLNRRIDVFTATGQFEGAIGWNVDSSSSAEELQFCTTATGCKAGVSGSAAGQFANLEVAGVAVDPRNGDLYVADFGNLRLNEYEISASGSEVTGASFIRGIGWNVNLSVPALEVQECTVLSGCQAGTPGGEPGQFALENPGPIAVDSDGSIYAVNVRYSSSCSLTQPCNVLKFNSDGTFKETFGPSAGECELNYTSGTARLREPVDIAVDPVGADHDNRVFVIKKVGNSTYRVYEFDESGTECTASPGESKPALSGSSSAASHGLAVGVEARIYANQNSGEVTILGEAPPAEVEMTEVKDVGATGATFLGVVTPPALEGVDTSWHFEYSTDQSHWTPVPVPSSTVASEPGEPEAVEEVAEGLVPNTTYFARLCATTGPTSCTTALEFTTEAAPPTVIAYSEEVTETEATLAANISPNHLATSYHFEWATEAEWEAAPGAYGHRSPAKDHQIGSGSEAVKAFEEIGGLSAASLYHFRVVATNGAGVAVSPDVQVETLDSCGLPSGRCFEMVSPPDKGSVGEAGKPAAFAADLQYQVLPQGAGLAYTLAAGLSDATAGGEVLYRASRSGAGWSSSQFSPPALVTSELRGESAYPGRVGGLNADLSCGVVASPYPLAEGAPTAPVEAGGGNLFRWARDGSYTTITALSPVNADAVNPSPLERDEYAVLGMSPDCERVIFRTPYHYPGIPGAGEWRLYEWNEGKLHNVGEVPGPSGAVVTEAVGGSWAKAGNPGVEEHGKGGTNYVGAVSPAGAKMVFSAPRQTGTFFTGLNKPAVFLRNSGGTIEVSASETATSNTGRSLYQIASWQGDSRVFFTARYGLALNGSSAGATSCENQEGQSGAGCDLYEFDLQKFEAHEPALTDLSVDTTDTEGAGVGGVLGSSADGTYVYFAARGKLGGDGKSYAQNVSGETYNVYLAHLDPQTDVRETRVVGTLNDQEVIATVGSGEAVVNSWRTWNSQVTPSGKALVFASTANVTGYLSGGVKMAYLYSAETNKTICLSCRPDGEPSVAADNLLEPLSDANYFPTLHPRVSLAADGSRAFFFSEDVLATGAAADVKNLYEWRQRGSDESGQIALLASEPAGLSEPDISRNKKGLIFGGASADGGDLYFATPKRLTWEDVDNHYDVYDARVGGGFAETPPLPPACDPGAEGSCQAASGGGPVGAAAGSSTFSGPGNPPVQSQRHKKRHHKKKPKHRKHHHRKHKHHGKKKHKHRRANGNRRAGK